jgi:hypothetical protein
MYYNKAAIFGAVLQKSRPFWGGSVAEVFGMNSKIFNPFGLN